MINIVCVKWGTKFGPEYVNNLFAGIKRNTTVDYKFHCFTDDSRGLCDGIIIQPLEYKYVYGWWNKLALFSRDNPIPKGERIFFLDLDVLIINNIDDILSYESNRFLILQDWYRKNNNVNSTCMSWISGEYHYIWDNFIFDSEHAMYRVKKLGLLGDQGWTQIQLKDYEFWQSTFHDKFVSFKQSCISGFPKDTAIICYHGKPSIPDSATQDNSFLGYLVPPQKWVLKYWRQ